jgi:hypothetical protein
VLCTFVAGMSVCRRIRDVRLSPDPGCPSVAGSGMSVCRRIRQNLLPLSPDPAEPCRAFEWGRTGDVLPPPLQLIYWLARALALTGAPTACVFRVRAGRDRGGLCATRPCQRRSLPLPRGRGGFGVLACRRLVLACRRLRQDPLPLSPDPAGPRRVLAWGRSDGVGVPCRAWASPGRTQRGSAMSARLGHVSPACCTPSRTGRVGCRVLLSPAPAGPCRAFEWGRTGDVLPPPVP